MKTASSIKDDCPELAAEIERGEQALKALAQHLIEMGANSMGRVIEIDGFIVEISAAVLSDNF